MARLTVNLTGEARKSAIDLARLFIITETVHSSTPSAIYGRDRKGHIQIVCRSSGKPVRKEQMPQHMVEQRTENIAVDVFSTYTHVDKPQILLQISNSDLVFELDTVVLLQA